MLCEIGHRRMEPQCDSGQCARRRRWPSMALYPSTSISDTASVPNGLSMSLSRNLKKKKKKKKMKKKKKKKKKKKLESMKAEMRRNMTKASDEDDAGASNESGNYL